MRRISLGYAALLSLLLGTLFFHLRMRLILINPTNFEWLWSGDWANAATGFLFFVKEAWQWPLGKMNGLLAPLGTSIGFTDSMPLVALLFKSVGAWLPYPFHYLGLWIWLCFVLQVFFAYRIFETLGLKEHEAWGGALVLGLAPPLMYRIGHVSLCSHFLLLAGIDQYLRFRKSPGAAKAMASVLLVLVASGIHPYIWAMVFLLSLSIELEDLKRFWVWRRWQDLRRPALSVGLKFSLSFLCLKAFGYFLPADKDHGGFSFYRGDLTAFFNPMGEKAFLPRISASEGQYEAYAYLGLGSVLALLFCVVTVAGRERLRRAFRMAWPLLVVCGAGWIYSLSNEVSVAGKVFLDLAFVYRFLEPLPSVFRSSGRFAWPAFYLLSLFVWYVAFRQASTQKWGLWVWALVGIQILDLAVFFNNVPPRTERVKFDFEADFEKLAVEKEWKKLVVLPQGGWGRCAGQEGLSFEFKKNLVYFAAFHRLSTNMGDVSRFPKAELERQCELDKARLQRDEAEAGSVYLVYRSEWAELLGSTHRQLRCLPEGDFQLCWKESLPTSL